MDARADIEAYRKRREQRLRNFHADAAEKKKGTRIPYALCKAEGIETSGMTPREAWEALKEKTGRTPQQSFSELKNKRTPRSGKLESLEYKESGDVGLIGSKSSFKIANQNEWEKNVDKEIRELPLGAIISLGRHKYVKLKGNKWGEAAELRDPRYQIEHGKLLGDLMTGAALNSPISYEVPKPRKKKDPEKVKKERKEFLLSKWPGFTVEKRRTGDGYTDFIIAKTGDKALKKKYRVYENAYGEPKMCPLYKN